jgi:hypothetical protein
MANNYYNTMGQRGHIGGALSAAGLAASSNAANATMAGNMGLNIGGFGGGGMGGGGFNVSGPGGNVASGSQGGWGSGWAGAMGGGSQGGWNNSVQRGGSESERGNILGQGFNYLGQTMGYLNDPNNPAMALAGLANNQFNANREATMNPQFLNSMNSALTTSQSGMNKMFNKSGAAMSQYGTPDPRGRYDYTSGSDYRDSDFWNESPSGEGSYRLAATKPGGWGGAGKSYLYEWVPPKTLSEAQAREMRTTGKTAAPGPLIRHNFTNNNSIFKATGMGPTQ